MDPIVLLFPAVVFAAVVLGLSYGMRRMPIRTVHLFGCLVLGHDWRDPEKPGFKGYEQCTRCHAGRHNPNYD